MSYKISNFYPKYGELEILTDEDQNTFKVMIPIVNGEFYSGNDLTNMLTAFHDDRYTPERMQLASSANTEILISMIDPIAQEFSILKQRNKLLLDSDWTQLPDVSLANVADWKTYRQTLRDISKQKGFPSEIVWPVSPQ